MIEEAIFSMFSADPTIKDIVGDNVYPGGVVPQGKPKPAITFQMTGGPRDYDMEGSTKWRESRYLIAAHAEGKGKRGESHYMIAKRILRAVEARIDAAGAGYHVIGSTEIQSIRINGENESPTESADNKDATRLWLDCTFFHREV